jgi:hypothetical protein
MFLQVALLNSIESEYEDMFRNAKCEPKSYGFEDWEDMLKSPQFKKYLFVYTDKKMQYVKGLPMARSAVITMRHNRWEIDPRIGTGTPISPRDEEVEPQPAVYSAKPNFSRSSSISTVTTEIVDSECSISSRSRNVPNIVSPPAQKDPSSPPPKIWLGLPKSRLKLAHKMDPDFLSSTRVKTSVIVRAKSSSRLDEDRGARKESNTTEAASSIEAKKSSRPAVEDTAGRTSPVSDREEDYSEEEGSVIVLSGEDQNKTVSMEYEKSMQTQMCVERRKEIPKVDNDNIATRPEVDGHNFFRRSELPEEWTKTRFEEEERSSSDKQSLKGSREGEDEGANLTDDLVIDEDYRSAGSVERRDAEDEVYNRGKSYSPPTPPPPVLHRMDIILPRQAYVKDLLRQFSKGKRIEKEDNIIAHKKNIDEIVSEDCITASSIRRISQSTEEGQTSQSDNSANSSPTGFHSGSTRNCDAGESFCEWKARPVLVGEITAESEARFWTQIRLKEMYPGSKVDLARDPRLSNGIRSKFKVQGDEGHCEILAETEDKLKSETSAKSQGKEETVRSNNTPVDISFMGNLALDMDYREQFTATGNPADSNRKEKLPTTDESRGSSEGINLSASHQITYVHSKNMESEIQQSTCLLTKQGLSQKVQNCIESFNFLLIRIMGIQLESFGKSSEILIIDNVLVREPTLHFRVMAWQDNTPHCIIHNHTYSASL